jgi:hypothetical protein
VFFVVKGFFLRVKRLPDGASLVRATYIENRVIFREGELF